MNAIQPSYEQRKQHNNEKNNEKQDFNSSVLTPRTYLE